MEFTAMFVLQTLACSLLMVAVQLTHMAVHVFLLQLFFCGYQGGCCSGYTLV